MLRSGVCGTGSPVPRGEPPALASTHNYVIVLAYWLHAALPAPAQLGAPWLERTGFNYMRLTYFNNELVPTD
ncbi:unnamed protein product [Leptosia nina]|uniref:Uncharacterized protein n=1 Tax=Leptosia nina TaxID=320188 RepID=A0AAV1JY48_9NEOP